VIRESGLTIIELELELGLHVITYARGEFGLCCFQLVSETGSLDVLRQHLLLMLNRLDIIYSSTCISNKPLATVTKHTVLHISNM